MDEEYVVVQHNFSTVLVMDVIVCVHKCVFVCVQVTQQLTAHADIKKSNNKLCLENANFKRFMCYQSHAMPIMLKGEARRLSKLCVSALFLFSSLQVYVLHAFWSVSIQWIGGLTAYECCVFFL